MNSPSRFLLQLHNTLTFWKGRPEFADPTPEQTVATACEAGSWVDQNDLATKMGFEASEACLELGWEKSSIYRLEDVWLTGDQGQVYLRDGRLFAPWVTPYEAVADRLKLRLPCPAFAPTLEGPIFHLTGRNHENRGHFMLQYLPRLMAAKPYLDQIPDHRILVAPGHRRWQGRYLKWLGFDEDRLIECSRGTLRVRDLIFLPQVYDDSGLCPPEFYRNLNQAAIDADAPEVGDAPALFISRKDAPDKRLINEDRIVDLLRSRIGEIKVIELGDYSLMEQIAMFRKAPLVIGPIGQGICNALFCRGSVLVVLAPGEEGAEVYKSSHGVTLARICGNEAMTFLSGEDVPSRGDWEFPESRFSELMDRLLAQPEAARILPQTP